MLVVEGDDRRHPWVLGFLALSMLSRKSVGDTESGQVNLGKKKTFSVAVWGNVAGCCGNAKGLQKDVT